MSTQRKVWWVCWTCGCDEYAERVEDLPERCPGHGKLHIEKPQMLTPADPDSPNHVCGHEGTCPEAPP